MRIFVVSVLVWLVGCGASSSYARVTAGRIGCPASEIELDEIEQGERGPEAWVASCGHSRYVCSSNITPSDPRARIMCSELGHPTRSLSNGTSDPRYPYERRHWQSRSVPPAS